MMNDAKEYRALINSMVASIEAPALHQRWGEIARAQSAAAQAWRDYINAL